MHLGSSSRIFSGSAEAAADAAAGSENSGTDAATCSGGEGATAVGAEAAWADCAFSAAGGASPLEEHFTMAIRIITTTIIPPNISLAFSPGFAIPQCGHTFALLDTCFLHSLQFVSAIRSSK